jgi:hypothetical protein
MVLSRCGGGTRKVGRDDFWTGFYAVKLVEAFGLQDALNAALLTEIGLSAATVEYKR